MTISNRIQSALPLITVIPEDVFVKIFVECCDEQTLRSLACVCKYFDNLQKDDALWVVHIGTNDRDRCILNLRRKTITIEGDRLSFGHCWRAMNYPTVPKGSFAAYPRGDHNIALVIKDRDGQIKHVLDAVQTFYKVRPRAEAEEIKQQIGKPTEYSYFAHSIELNSPQQNTEYAEGIKYLTESGERP